MKTIQLKTSMKCQGCVAKIQPSFDQNPAIQNWSVDLTQTPKILTVETDSLSAEDIQSLLTENGFKSETL